MSDDNSVHESDSKKRRIYDLEDEEEVTHALFGATEPPVVTAEIITPSPPTLIRLVDCTKKPRYFYNHTGIMNAAMCQLVHAYAKLDHSDPYAFIECWSDLFGGRVPRELDAQLVQIVQEETGWDWFTRQTVELAAETATRDWREIKANEANKLAVEGVKLLALFFECVD